MKKLKLADKMISLFGFPFDAGSHGVQMNGDTDFEDRLFSPKAFIYFWDKFEDKFTNVINFQKTKEGYICTISTFLCLTSDCIGKSPTRIEAFYRAIVEYTNKTKINR